jgi:glycosyltransferase involved in cell wall biosynthesis
MTKKVLIIQRIITDYRVPFYLRLAELLEESGIELSILAGAPWQGEAFKDCRDELPFVQKTENVHWVGPAYWMRGAPKAARGKDLVIFENANGALHHYVLQLKRILGGETKCAFWGHGANLNKTEPHLVRDAWRNFWMNKVDGWFAYTQLSAAIVARNGFPAERITTVQNAIDTTALMEAQGQLTLEDTNALCRELFGETVATPTGVFCGRLTVLKWIPFLLEVLLAIRKIVPDFRMVIVGDGSERQRVDLFCQSNPWCVCVGAKHDTARVPYLALGDVWFNPGMTGLSILDSFALGLPFLTTDNGIHSPEIEYLEKRKNGDISPPDVSAFSKMAADLLCDKKRLTEMKNAARLSGLEYTIENMASNFAEGVLKALKPNGGNK